MRRAVAHSAYTHSHLRHMRALVFLSLCAYIKMHTWRSAGLVRWLCGARVRKRINHLIVSIWLNYVKLRERVPCERVVLMLIAVRACETRCMSTHSCPEHMVKLCVQNVKSNVLYL